MKATLIGLQHINFTNTSGETINGKNIFVAFKDENIEGYRTEKFFLREGIELPTDTKINDSIEIAYNYKGRIEKVTKVSK
jgi:hypothetical protein